MAKRVLFVCTGNTCRSPMAAAVFLHLCHQRNRYDIEVDSAGINALDGLPVSDHARTVLQSMGIPLLRLGSHRLTPKGINGADLVVVMTGRHRDAVVERFPRAKLKTVPLLAFSEEAFEHVPDPFGCGIDVYRDCLELMTPALVALADEVTA